MSFKTLTSSAVIRFQFLWGHEANHGETEGSKPRPVVVGFRINDNLLLLFPVTTKQPEATRFFKEIPETEKRRAGLNPDHRSWIILDEINTDVISQSVYLEPNCEMGRFSRAFTLHVFRAWVNERKSRKMTIINRHE